MGNITVEIIETVIDVECQSPDSAEVSLVETIIEVSPISIPVPPASGVSPALRFGMLTVNGDPSTYSPGMHNHGTPEIHVDGVTIVGTGNEDSPLIAISADAVELDILAVEDIPALSIITSTGYKANSSNVFHKNIIAGITINEILTGFRGLVISSGQVSNSGWNWNRGDIIFLNGTLHYHPN